jgi:signal transduction histidine kinase/CheY-like chemotaxis protein/CHASE3 domain sensor protein
MNSSSIHNRANTGGGAGILLAFSAVLAMFIATGVVTYFNTHTLSQNSQLVVHAHEVLAALENVISLAKDAETGQRGFLITGDEHYLQPYDQAVERLHAQLDELERLTDDQPEQQARVPPVRAAVEAKLAELAETIALRRDEGFEAARKVVVTDRGKAAMDSIRSHIDGMQLAERALREQRIVEMDRAYTTAVLSGIGTGILGALLSAAVTYLLFRAARLRFRQDWIQAGQLKLSQAMSGDQNMARLSENILRSLCEHLDAQVAAIYVEEASRFRREATYGVPAESTPAEFDRTDGLLGQAAKDRRAFLLRDVPSGYLTLGSALGKGSPRHLFVFPTTEDGEVNGVVELGFLQPVGETAADLLGRVSESIGVAIRAVKYRAHLQNLLEETQRQGEELQAQSEELRVGNEELEEQSRALKESQARLENQQAELEQTNSQLEEQTQLLELQRDETNRTNAVLERQAKDLAQASQYKSEFLANMSHELRTPLNSSLILAKLLADNPEGNLSAEQVKYAQTIQAAGNDLLALINDILDLSKIEAGRMEVRLEQVPIEQLLADLARSFQPMAAEKHLDFIWEALPGCPAEVETDRQRLEQVLKNLLSNAIKFTESGSVALHVSRAHDGRVAFAVADTGIGVPADQQERIFEAFRQADSTTSRKYGGTGLGLSISRELVRLLGGEIQLASEPGKGSTFTVLLSEHFPKHERPGATRASLAVPAYQPAPNPVVAPTPIPTKASDRVDGRSPLRTDRRTMLVVEDDKSFSQIVCDLAQRLNFQCLTATTAEQAFAAAVEHLPQAIVLDIGLPDHSGLVVLDQLKHDRRTRHIPVHVVSASDVTDTALELGAVGSMLKPVSREQLVTAMQQLEARLSQQMGRVLVVEDDAVQRESLQALLRSQHIETVGAATAAECLERLRETTFDCMVLDLSLPDASGYALLETLSREQDFAFPPVIVYTGRALSSEEEHHLRRYSKAIIIKGVKSPERLLDEVTLFLHKVVSDLPLEQQRLLEKARSRDAALEGRRILVVEDDVRNVFALTTIFELRGASVEIARNGREAIQTLEQNAQAGKPVDLVLMDVMMPEMDGLTAVREIRTRKEWKKLPVIMLTAKAMADDHEQCIMAGANDYMAKPLDVERLLSLVRVWIPR